MFSALPFCLFAGGSPYVHPCEETYLPEPIERATGATCIPRGDFAGLSGRSNFGQIDILVCVLTWFSIQFNSFLGHLYPCPQDSALIWSLHVLSKPPWTFWGPALRWKRLQTSLCLRRLCHANWRKLLRRHDALPLVWSGATVQKVPKSNVESWWNPTNPVAQIILIFVERYFETTAAPEMTQHDPMTVSMVVLHFGLGTHSHDPFLTLKLKICKRIVQNHFPEAPVLRRPAPLNPEQVEEDDSERPCPQQAGLLLALRSCLNCHCLAGLAPARHRLCSWGGEDWGKSAPALVFNDVQWVMICESAVFCGCRIFVWGHRMPKSGWRATAEDWNHEISFTAVFAIDDSTVLAKNGPVFG